jgi:hypothetical protein
MKRIFLSILILLWAAFAWAIPPMPSTSGTGTVSGTGDCASGACYDGSSDGGTYIRLYDGTSAYTGITAGVRTLTLAPSNANAESLIITFGNNDNTLTLGSGTGASVSINGNAGTVTNFTGTTALTNQGGAGILAWPAAGATLTIPSGGGTLGTAAFTAATAYDVAGAAAARQADLSLVKGTYTDANLCTYTASGTVLNCNTATSTFQTYNALLASLAGLTTTAGDIIYFTAANTAAILDAGTQYKILQMGASYPEWVSSLAVESLNLASAKSSVPMPVNTTTTELTTAGSLHYESDADILSIGDGTTDIDLTFTPGTDIVFPAVSGTLQTVKAEKIASFSWDGGGSAVATAGSKRCTLIPVAYTVTGYNMVVDQDPGAGTTILNLDKDAIGDGTTLATTDMDGAAHAYPPTMPDNKVAVNDTTITGWTTAVSANDMICAAVATNAVATWISLTIYGTK